MLSSWKYTDGHEDAYTSYGFRLQLFLQSYFFLNYSLTKWLIMYLLKIHFLSMSFTYNNISDIDREKVFYRSVSFGSVLVRFKKQFCLSVNDYWVGCRWLKWQEAAQGYGCLPDKWHRGHTTRSSTNARGKKKTPSGKSVTDHCHVLCILIFSI